MSDLDALAREYSDVEEYILAAFSDKSFNLKKDKDTIEFLRIIFDNAHKDLDMAPMQVTEKKATYCGRCGHTHVKGTPCPRPFKEGLSTHGDDAYFVVPNKGKMKKEDILKAIKEVLTEDIPQNIVTTTNKPEIKKALQQRGVTDTSVVDKAKPGQIIAAEDLDLGHQDDEPHMIKSELYKIAKYSLELYKMVDQFEGKGEVDFPAWWQSKVTKATSMISSAKHYLEFELTEPAMDQAVVGAEAPINEGNLGHNELASLEKEGGSWIVTYRTMDGKKEKVFTDEDEARTFMGTVSETKKKLDPVGHEDEDIDNDGKENTKTDKYLKGRRVKIGAAIAQHSKKK